MSITLDSGHLTMKGSSKATIKSSIKIVGTNSVLPIEIVGDFKDIPQNLHGMYIQAMQSSYGSVNIHNNTETETEPEPKTIEEQKSEWRLNRIVDIIAKAISHGKA